MMSNNKNMSVSQRKRIEDAEQFIAFNKSDPFCRNRVYAHMKSGIAGFTESGEDAFYTATPVKGEYGRTTYINVKCP